MCADEATKLKPKVTTKGREEERQSTWKIIQSNNGKDDSKSQKKNGGIDQEDTRNVLKREDLKNKQRWTT